MTSITTTFKRTTLAIALLGTVLTVGCKGNQNPDADSETLPEATDSAKSTLLKVDGQIFSIPSPIQTATLIKESGVGYNKTMLNPANKSNTYTSNFKKAINLGIYGADLGYVTIYDQTQDALAYMNAVKKIAEEVGVSAAFNAELLERFQKNLSSKDSMLTLVSEAYRESDAFLKNNERKNLSGLVLAGGWIEGLYFATNALKTKPNQEIKNRVAEQKSSLESLVKLLNQYSNEPEVTGLLESFTDLYADFSGIEYKYIYEKPTVDPAKKLTIINSRTEIKMTDEQLKTISDKVAKLRTALVG